MDNNEKAKKNDYLYSNDIDFKENIKDLVIPKQKIYMKSNKKLRISIFCFFIIVSLCGVSLLFYAFGNLSSRQSNLSQGDILKMTSYSKSDDLFIRQLKDKALSDWISTRNVTKLLELNNNEKLVSAIASGKIPESKLDDSLAVLSKNVSGNEEEIGKLRVRYEVAVLEKNTEKLDECFNNIKVNDFKSQQVVLSQADIVLHSLNISSSVWLNSPNSDFSLLSKINTSIDTLNKIQEQFSIVRNYTDMLKRPSGITEYQLMDLSFPTPFASQLSSNYNQITDYVSQKTQIEAQKEAIQALKNKLANTVSVPDFVGKSVGGAKKELSIFNKSNGSNIKLEGADNVEDSVIVLTQTPSPIEFDKMKKDGVLILGVPSQPSSSTEAPKTSTSIRFSSDSSDKKGFPSKENESSNEDTQHVDTNQNDKQNSTTVHVND